MSPGADIAPALVCAVHGNEIATRYRLAGVCPTSSRYTLRCFAVGMRCVLLCMRTLPPSWQSLSSASASAHHRGPQYSGNASRHRRNPRV